VFRQNGEYLMERFVRPETGGSGSGFSLQFSLEAEQRLLYLIDGTNQRVWILRRKDLAILDRFGRPGRQAGEFIRAHMIAIDSKRRMYTGEAGNGRRMQRWILRGTRAGVERDAAGPGTLELESFSSCTDRLFHVFGFFSVAADFLRLQPFCRPALRSV
jgi:hypothetical protein